MQRKQRQKVVRYWWEKSKESFDSAWREFSAGVYSLAVNRLYYAAFYAVSAVLLEYQFSFKKHSGVRSTFHREFVKTGLMDTKWGKFYDQLFEDRQEGDYIALVQFDKEYVSPSVPSCTWEGESKTRLKIVS